MNDIATYHSSYILTRALLLSLDKRTDRDVNLIYSSNGKYLFKDAIDNIIEANKSFNVDYVSSAKDTEEKYLVLAKKYKNQEFYYISGNPKAINSIKKSLRKNGIKKSRMINDPFLGY